MVVATYLLAPGYFADKIRTAALGAGAAAVSGVLGAAPEVANVVLDRYLAAAAANQSIVAGAPYPVCMSVAPQLGICASGGNPRGTDARRTAASPIT